MTTNRLPDLLRQHVESLAAAHGAEITFDRDAEPRARWDGIVRGRPVNASVTVPPIKTRDDYYIALHEVGHVARALLDVAFAGDSELLGEALAWEWALENAAVPPTPRTWRTIYRGWNSYVQDEAAEWPVLDPRWVVHLQTGGAYKVPGWARDGYLELWRLVGKRGRLRLRRRRR
jgi:hypothetical protein